MIKRPFWTKDISSNFSYEAVSMRKTQSVENLPEISSWLIGLTLMSANQINLKKTSSFENTKGF